jgi:hypothetical protein
MGSRFPIGTPASRIFRRVLDVDYCPAQILALFEMHRQLSRDLRYPVSIAGLLAGTDLAVQLRSASGRETLVQHIAVQDVKKVEAGADRAIGPC